MYNVYTRLAVPDVSREVLEPGLVCAASWNQQWYRVQVSIERYFGATMKRLSIIPNS